MGGPEIVAAHTAKNWTGRPPTMAMPSVREYVFYVFLDFKNVTFFEMTCQKVVKVVSKSLVLNSSKWVHILRSVITVIHFSYLFVSLAYLMTHRHFYVTHSSKLHSFLWMWTLRPHFWAECLMLVTYRTDFRNCVLKTGVMKWPLKVYVRF